MKYLVALLLFSIFNFQFSIPVYSQATSSAEFDQQVQQNIKTRIDKVVEEKATASGEVLASKTLIKRGWVGTIADIAQTTLTLTASSGTKQTSFSDTTTFVESPGKKTLKSTDLELGAHVIAIGFINGNGVMDLRRLIIVTDFKTTPSREVRLVTLTQRPEGLTAKTVITSGPEQKKATAKDLTPDAKALLITVAGKLVRIHLL
ncbi:MAG: hypothetical protein A2784_01255 [Candidatus Chisholmbacteria bacterium RIFCSPHIGHO2_01_FULL_48_12]|uniref:DUF5666 domain-containing protein n=1 Tax=Candidatus Chisholmbacteria bacterium RIFCSPHIGHO2_01_FULL_48_12 TaxID=1797589 RepID=A0A1G1VQS1_9BACT|nr:MAG: hypothetical protein A2784_01255 [Candidatus Chisholmbacteria bacterium RIFCSPHIGHO2_01_FULL_48_12]